MKPKHQLCLVAQYIALRHPTEDTILIVEQVSRINGTRAWTLPGGKFEVEESLEASLKREVLEETGLEFTKAQLVNADTWMSLKSGVMKLGMVYVGIASTDTVVLSDEHIGFQWCSKEEIKKLPFYKEFMKQACLRA